MSIDLVTAVNRPPIAYKARGLSTELRIHLHRFLLLGMSFYDIAEKLRVSPRTVHRHLRNLFWFGSTRRPALRKLGRPRKLTLADENAVLDLFFLEGLVSAGRALFLALVRERRLSNAAHSLENVKKTRLVGKRAAAHL